MKPPNDNDTAETLYPSYVGPYKIGNTLGQGQTGIVKLGIHCKTKEKSAIKIICKEKLKPSILQKVEREIAIMRLIEHPHVLGLYDVYESSRYLYLVLEHVSGGELFDYLVNKGRLTSIEAGRFFRQMVSALDFCHRYGVCHRDLKPENLLLDDKKNLKVADFGMASLQLENSLLETSCGSPHYACPEVIKGGSYDGKQADVWSSGIILYALLVGSLPFDHQDMSKLLERVRHGKYSIPSWMPDDAKSLIQQMLQVVPDNRISLHDVFKHPFLMQCNDIKDSNTYLTPIETVLYTHPLNTKDDLDRDIVKQMASLGCFESFQQVSQNLIDKRHNTEKVLYFLLLDRKRRQPALKDDIPLRKRWKNRTSSREHPQKRVDSVKFLDTPSSPHLTGSHRQLCKTSSAGEATDCSSPKPLTAENRRYSLGTPLDSITEQSSSSGWRRLFSTFSHRSLDHCQGNASSHRSLERLTLQREEMASRDSVSRDSISRGNTASSRDKLVEGKHLSLSLGNNLPQTGLVRAHSSDREEESKRSSLLPWKQKNRETFLVLHGTTLNQFSIDLVGILLKYKISHSVVFGGYQCKYNSSKKGLLSKSVKFYVTAEERSASMTGNDVVICASIQYKSGSTKKFKRLCEKIQLALFRPSSTRPFSPILRKVCSYVSEDTDSHGSLDMLSENCSDPSF